MSAEQALRDFWWAKIKPLETPETVQRKIGQLFSQHDRASVNNILQQGRVTASAPTFQLLMLRFAEGSLEKLRQQIEEDCDPKEILIFALYRRETEYTCEHDFAEAPQEVIEDLRSYFEWLQDGS